MEKFPHDEDNFKSTNNKEKTTPDVTGFEVGGESRDFEDIDDTVLLSKEEIISSKASPEAISLKPESKESLDIPNKIDITLFNDVIEQFEDKEQKNRVFSLILFMQDYCTEKDSEILRDVLNKEKIGDALLNHKKEQLFADVIISFYEKRYNLDAKNNKAELLDIIEDALIKKEGNYYHGTNGFLAEKIVETGGLKRGERGYEDDINEILKITKEAGMSESANEIFGWYNVGSQGQISFTGDPELAINYAKRSPEWFSQFCSNWNGDPFAERDYEKAKKSVEDKIKRWSNQESSGAGYKNITEEGSNKIRVFFEKYWKIFTEKEPIVMEFNVGTTPDLNIYPALSIFSNTKIPEDIKEPSKQRQYIIDNVDSNSLKMSLGKYLNYKYLQVNDGRFNSSDVNIKDIKNIII